MTYEIQLLDLKKLTTTEKNFSVPTKYFFDYIADNTMIKESSKPLTEDTAFYKALLEPITQKYFHGNAEIAGIYLMELKNQHFVHGIISLSTGAAVTLFFFIDIQLGMAIILG